MRSPFRSQLPTRSPLTAGALAAGLRGAVTGGEADRSWLVRHLGERYGARDVVLTDSGTSALRLALEGAAGAREGGAPGSGGPALVAMPAYSCYDLATATAGAGTPVVLYDVVPSSLAPDPDSLERALAAGARTVVVTPLYGVPVALEWLQALCEAREALLVEDAAQGNGAAYRGAPLGSRGSLAVLSFARGKGWTGGGGGALLAHDARGLAALRAVGSSDGAARGWSGLVRTAAQWSLGRPPVYGLPRRFPRLRLGETVYHEPWEPRGLSAAAAAALRATAEAAEEESRRRRENASRLLRVIETESRLRPIAPPAGSTPGWIRLPALVPEGAASAADPPERLGVYRGYPIPLHRLEALRPWLAGGADVSGAFPGAEALAARLVTLPTHGALRAGDLRALKEWIRSVDR